MATKNARKKESWWQTFPGVLTAVAGLITALAGLVAVLKNPRAGEPSSTVEQTAEDRHDAAPGGQKSPRSVRVSPEINSAAPGGGVPVPAELAGFGHRTASLPAGAEVGFSQGKFLVKVVAAGLEPFNAEKWLLGLKVRISNNDSSFTRNYYWTFRLLVDGVPRAPTIEPRREEIQALSAMDLAYVFEVPATAQKVIFRISRDEETHDIPIDLTLAAP